MKKVCVVIPAYNEESVISDVIIMSKKVFSKMPGFDIDIVVVNDGSQDETSSKVARAGGTVIDHILNSGAGGATLTGLAFARKNGYDIVATMDADGQHSPDDVIAGIRQLTKSGADLMIGSRLINHEGMSKIKILGNRGLSLITKILFGVNVSDSQSGLRIYSRKSLEKLDWKATGYEFCSEMIWRAKQLGLTIDEYPIKAIYTDYSKQKGQSNWNAVNIVRRLFKQRLVELFE